MSAVPFARYPAALIAASLGLAGLVASGAAQANVVYTQLPTALTTSPNSGGGCCDGTGVWFNPLTGYAEERGYFFPDNLYEDGKFFLLTDTSGGSAEAEVYVQGLFSRGNGVIYQSASNLNPALFGVGQSIGPASGYQSPGAGYPDLGPSFGNWDVGRGFLGLTLRNPAGASSSDIYYGFADITVNADYTITLNAFAFENTPGQAIMTSFAAPVPEASPTAMLAAGLLVLGAVATRRRTNPAVKIR